MDGVIPFSDSVSHLLISLPRLSTADYQLQLSTKESSIIFPLHSLNSGGVHLIDNHGGGARVYFDTAHLYQTFIARNLSQKLFPGSYRTKLIIDGDTTLLPQMVKVFWFNAPSTLSNAEKALEMLSIINVKADSLKKLNKKASMEQLLYAFWRKYDTDTTTSYNELMSVFYSRCDYAIENFSTIQRDDGLETDRGKMYVRFGKPLEIERVATRAGKIGEVWKYSESRVFYFVDFSGTGKFEIVDEL
jgi:GWxTD domain-containing protein